LPILDLEAYIPTYLTQCTNKWASSSSRMYLVRFGIGINEWRVMTLLASAPGITASRMSVIMGLDKALVSRAIVVLEEQKYATRGLPQSKGRREAFLTPGGWSLHNKILKLALAREAKLLHGFSKAEIGTLLKLLKRLTENAVRLQNNEAEEFSMEETRKEPRAKSKSGSL
jgi:DNA-binding MarR family transcriptional regulator